MTKTPKSNVGRALNERWKVYAKHALYRANGTWYHRLTNFPGALFDANGYVLFETEEEYINCPYLHIGKETSCHKGISSIPSYILINITVEQAVDTDEPEAPERALSVINRIVRDTPLARRVKNLHSNRCQVCGLTLSLFERGSYAEAHHIKPLGSTHCGPDVIDNIICVCPNCHAQLDYGAIELSKNTLTFVREHRIKEEYIDYHNSVIYREPSGSSR